MVKGTDLVRYEGLFRKEYAEAAAKIMVKNAYAGLVSIASEIPSSKGVEDYRWFGELPQFTEWFGDRKIGDLKDYHYYLNNKHFESAVKIDSDELDDDNLGMILTRVRALPAGVPVKWGKLIHEALINGTSEKAFDGVAFFSAASGDRKFSNLLTGSISAATPTLAQVVADIEVARSSMAAYTDANGDAMGIVPDTFVVPPQLEGLFRQALESQSVDGNSGTLNPIKGAGRVVVDPALTDKNDFYALATEGYEVGALIMQKRQEVETALLDYTKVNKTVVFGADFRGAVGYGFPCLAAKVVSSVN